MKIKNMNLLEQEILAIAINCSSVTAVKNLKRGTADISKSTICKRSTFGLISIYISTCCLDDFSVKKRRRYGCVLVDLHSHRIINLIDLRNIPEVSEWLKNYPNISIFIMDKSSSYKSAITEANPNAVFSTWSKT